MPSSRPSCNLRLSSLVGCTDLSSADIVATHLTSRIVILSISSPGRLDCHGWDRNRGWDIWYDRGMISQGKGAEIAGLTRVEFIDALGRANVNPAIQITAAELRAEKEMALNAGR